MPVHARRQARREELPKELREARDRYLALRAYQSSDPKLEPHQLDLHRWLFQSLRLPREEVLEALKAGAKLHKVKPSRGWFSAYQRRRRRLVLRAEAR
jgi:hypothetical protein